MKKISILFFALLIVLASKAQQPQWIVYDTSNSSLPGNEVMDIAITEGNKWIGTLKKGITKFDGIDWDLYNKDNSNLPGNEIGSIDIDETGNPWITVAQVYDFNLLLGIAEFDGSNWTLYNTSTSGIPHNRINKILIDNQGNKWMSTAYLGIVKFDGTNWTVYDTSNSGLPHNDICLMAIDNQGNKWMGPGQTGLGISQIQTGLVKFDDTSWTVYNTSNSGLPENYISAVAIDQMGNKWIGTGGGVAVFNETGVSVEEKEQSRNDLKIYPNPASDNVRLSMNPAIENIRVYDLTGKQIKHIDRIQAKKTSVNLSDIEPGIYLFRIRAGDQILSRKIVKY